MQSLIGSMIFQILTATFEVVTFFIKLYDGILDGRSLW